MTEYSNTDNLFQGVVQGCLYGQQDRVDALNSRINSRQFADIDLRPNYDPRPIQTKYNHFPIIDQNRCLNIKEPLQNYDCNKYNSHSSIMKIIIYMLIPIIILALLYNNGILPKPIYLILVIIISIIGFYFLWTTFFYYMKRDNMNYQEFNWDFNQKNAPVLGTNGTPDDDPWSGGTSTVCVGAQCCNQYEAYDVSLNQCVSITNNSSTSDNSTSGTDLNATVSNTLNNINQGVSNIGTGISNDYNSFSSYISNNF
jgi:hypothetical protein